MNEKYSRVQRDEREKKILEVFVIYPKEYIDKREIEKSLWIFKISREHSYTHFRTLI